MLSSKQNKMDSRLFERFSSNFPLAFKECGSGPENDIELQDFSAQGLSLTARKYLVNNERIELVVDLQDDQPEMVLEGTVVWSQADEEKGWRIGVKFSPVKLMRMSRLYRALNLTKGDDSPLS